MVVACITETSLSTSGTTMGQTTSDCSLNCTAARAWELKAYLLIKQGELFDTDWQFSYRISGVWTDLLHGVKSFSRMQSRYPLQFMNPKDHNRVHKIPPLISLLSQINPVHNPHPIFKIPFNFFLSCNIPVVYIIWCKGRSSRTQLNISVSCVRLLLPLHPFNIVLSSPSRSSN